MRLKGAQKIAKFYENVVRDLDPQNMTWLVIKRFLEEVLVERANVAMLKLNGILKSKNDGK